MVSRLFLAPAAFLVTLAGCGNESPGIPVSLKDHRFTPTEIRELDKRYALIQLVHRRDPYPAQRVNIERS